MFKFAHSKPTNLLNLCHEDVSIGYENRLVGKQISVAGFEGLRKLQIGAAFVTSCIGASVSAECVKYVDGQCSHEVVESAHASKEEADAECAAFFDVRGFTSSAYDVCNYNSEFVHTNGYVPSYFGTTPPEAWTYTLARFYYPSFYIAEDYQKACTSEGNPCDPATGRKFETEYDYSLSNSELAFNRYYSSWPVLRGSNQLSSNWTHSYAAQIGIGESNLSIEFDHEIRSNYFSTPQLACESGWSSIKDQAFRGLYDGATATYSNGICTIDDGSGNTRTLPLYSSITATNALGGSGIYSGHAVSLPDGSVYLFDLDGGSWVEENGHPVELIESGSSWIFTDEDRIEHEFVDGQLVSRSYPSGEVLTLEYTDGDLTRVLSNRGGELTFAYVDGLLDEVTTPAGVIQYGYMGDVLTSVTYPDLSVRTYHYEDVDLPYHLTGITDENGDRYATWAYDDDGRAILSTHAGDADRVDFSYSDTNHTTTVTDVWGSERVYHFGLADGDVEVTSITGDRCADCPLNQYTQISYDANGHISSGTDWNGSVTNFVREAERGLELSRTQAVGTSEERTILTEWHADYRLPTKITYPDKIIDFVYDSNGNLLSRTESPHSP